MMIDKALVIIVVSCYISLLGASNTRSHVSQWARSLYLANQTMEISLRDRNDKPQDALVLIQVRHDETQFSIPSLTRVYDDKLEKVSEPPGTVLTSTDCVVVVNVTQGVGTTNSMFTVEGCNNNRPILHYPQKLESFEVDGNKDYYVIIYSPLETQEGGRGCSSPGPPVTSCTCPPVSHQVPTNVPPTASEEPPLLTKDIGSTSENSKHCHSDHDDGDEKSSSVLCLVLGILLALSFVANLIFLVNICLRAAATKGDKGSSRGKEQSSGRYLEFTDPCQEMTIGDNGATYTTGAAPGITGAESPTGAACNPSARSPRPNSERDSVNSLYGTIIGRS